MIRKYLLHALLSSLRFYQCIGIIYKTETRKVNFTNKFIDDFGSVQACVKFLAGAPEDYTSSCFTAIKSPGGIFKNCDVSFDGTSCNKCEICSIDGKPGVTIDCFNVQPEENILTCTAFTNKTIKQALVDEYFYDVFFDFSLNTEDGSRKNQGNKTSGGGNLKNQWHTTSGGGKWKNQGNKTSGDGNPEAGVTSALDGNGNTSPTGTSGWSSGGSTIVPWSAIIVSVSSIFSTFLL